MDLIEISKKTKTPVHKLDEILLTQFNRIVLSEHNQIDESLYIRLMVYLGDTICRGEDNESQVEQIENTIITSPELECLKELSQIEYPEITYTKKLLEYCAAHHFLFFIDTCSLLNDRFYDFYKLLSEDKVKTTILFVPYVVFEELKIIRQKEDKEFDVRKKAEDRLKFIIEQCKLEKMKIVGDENDKRTNERGEKVIHADRVLIEKLIYFRNDSKSCLLITQDHGVTVDVLKQNDWQSTKSYAVIVVKKIGRHGALFDNSEDAPNPILPID